jgi:hypothetical protein
MFNIEKKCDRDINLATKDTDSLPKMQLKYQYMSRESLQSGHKFAES